MKIGIIIYSYSGNTLKVAEAIKEQLEHSGIITEINQITAVNDNPSSQAVTLDSKPNLMDYDGVILATPVRGFQIAPVMKAYLHQIEDCHKQRIYLFVTHHFALPWLGGTQTIKELRKQLNDKGAVVIGSSIINWSSKKRPAAIVELSNHLAQRKQWK